VGRIRSEMHYTSTRYFGIGHMMAYNWVFEGVLYMAILV
jgi:hypothetical protein